MSTIVEPGRTCPATALVDASPRAACELSVVIPVRDEEASLPATLAALAQQRGADSSLLDPDRYEIIVLVNNSVDASAAVARAVALDRPRLALHVAEVDL